MLRSIPVTAPYLNKGILTLEQLRDLFHDWCNQRADKRTAGVDGKYNQPVYLANRRVIQQNISRIKCPCLQQFQLKPLFHSIK